MKLVYLYTAIAIACCSFIRAEDGPAKKEEAPEWPDRIDYNKLDGPSAEELKKQTYSVDPPPKDLLDPDKTITKRYPGITDPTGHGGFIGTTVYFLVEKNVFYLRSDCGQGHYDGYLGPFKGDPRVMLAP